MNIEIISLKIKDIRKALGLTQEQMAEKLGLKRSSYTHIELGTTTLTLEQFINVVENHNINLDWFVYDKGEMFNQEEQTSINHSNINNGVNNGEMKIIPHIEVEIGELHKQLDFMREELKEKNHQIKEKDSLISRLLTKLNL
jgi:transcriptional regulator with XRE-family HTH domain